MRWHGGGRKPLTVKDATLIDDLRSLVEPSTRGGSASIAIMDGKGSPQPRQDRDRTQCAILQGDDRPWFFRTVSFTGSALSGEDDMLDPALAGGDQMMLDQLKRRDFTTLFIGVATWPLAARAAAGDAGDRVTRRRLA